MTLSQTVQSRLSAIIAQNPVAAPVELSGDVLDHPFRALTPPQRDLVWAVALDLSVYLFTHCRSVSLSTDTDFYRRMEDQLAACRVPLSRVGRSELSSTYAGLPGDVDAPIRLLNALASTPTSSVELGVLLGRLERSGYDTPPDSERRAMFHYCLGVRQGTTPLTTPFFDPGQPLTPGQRFRVEGRTFAVTFDGGVPAFVQVGYPKPEAGQTWKAGETTYLIAVGEQAVDLGQGTLIPLTPEGTLPGTELGLTFVRVQ